MKYALIILSVFLVACNKPTYQCNCYDNKSGEIIHTTEIKENKGYKAEIECDNYKKDVFAQHGGVFSCFLQP